LFVPNFKRLDGNGFEFLCTGIAKRFCDPLMNGRLESKHIGTFLSWRIFATRQNFNKKVVVPVIS